MQHILRNSNPRGGLDSRRLESFEHKLGAPLPEPYRSFFLRHNGCTIGPAESPTTFFAIDDQRLVLLPSGLLAIGQDQEQTPWLLGLKEKQHGKIFRQSRPARRGGKSQPQLVAEDFQSLLDLLAAETALVEGDEELFAEYLAEGHDINDPIFGRTPLDIALAARQMTLVQWLTARGAAGDSRKSSAA